MFSTSSVTSWYQLGCLNHHVKGKNMSFCKRHELFFIKWTIIHAWQCPKYSSVLPSLSEKCANMELFPVRIFPYSDWIRRESPYLDTFQAVHFTNITNIIYNLTGWEERIISIIIWMVYFRGKRLSRLQ